MAGKMIKTFNNGRKSVAIEIGYIIIVVVIKIHWLGLQVTIIVREYIWYARYFWNAWVQYIYIILWIVVLSYT